jgi:hypothetical protein
MPSSDSEGEVVPSIPKSSPLNSALSGSRQNDRNAELGITDSTGSESSRADLLTIIPNNHPSKGV